MGALFFGILCWDITADQQGLWNSVWAPVCAVVVVLILRLYTSRSRERVVFQHKKEVDTGMTLKTVRHHRHSTGRSMDMTTLGNSKGDGISSLDEKVRMWHSSVLQEGERQMNAELQLDEV